jgi:cell shape-determining protein MreC
MRYSRRNRFSPTTRIALAGAGILFLLILLLRFLVPGALPALFSPLLSFGNAIAGKEVDEQNQELINENEALKARLRDVGASEAIPTEVGILAGVTARPPVSPYDTYLLSRGSEAGIQENAIVFALGVPVGSIAEAGNRFARVLLYSSSGREVHGWIGEIREPITLIGKGAGAFSAEVSRDMPVMEGDTIYLPGPGAVPAGTVRSIERHAASPSALLHIEPLVNPYTVTYVRVLP